MRADRLRRAWTALAGTAPSARELAEVLWLAHRLDGSAGPAAVPGDPSPAGAPVPAAVASPPGAEPASPAPAPASGQPVGDRPGHGLHTRASGPGEGLGGSGLLVPAAPALGRRLALQRALRPLKQQVRSSHEATIDEEATADRIADQPPGARVWLPVVRPAYERWLDLSLVVDVGSSMAVWAQLADELRDTLIESGIFRNILVWNLDTDARTGVTVAPAGTTTSRPAEAVLRSGRRHLIAVLSDCSGAAWHGGAARAATALWGRRGPVVILQPLPERLWPRTGAPTTLGRAFAPTAAGPNSEIDFMAYDGFPAPPPGAVTVPVLEIDPDWIGRWARMITAAGPLDPVAMAYLAPGRPRPGAPAPPPRSPRDRVLDFRAAASAQAFQLARCLATTTPELPVMRLVQRAVLGQSTPAHLAEVVLSGLLRSVDGPAGRYEFVDGVREVLLDAATRSEAAATVNVLARVSAAIERDAGTTARRFRALIGDDRPDADRSADARPFALINSQALRRLAPPTGDPPAEPDAAPDVAPTTTRLPSPPPPPRTRRESSWLRRRNRRPAPDGDLNRRFGTTCPVCGAAFGEDEPAVDDATGRFVRPPSFRLEVGAPDDRMLPPWRVTMLAGNYPPAVSTDPPFNSYDVDFVYLLCGDGHIFPDATPAFGVNPVRGERRERVDDFNMVAAVGSPASGKTYLLTRTLSQNLDDHAYWGAGEEAGRIRMRVLSPLEALPAERRVERFNETRTSGAAISPTGTDSAAYPFGILRERFPAALDAIQTLIERTVLDGRRRADGWGKGFRQPLVVRTDSGDRRTWTGVADLPGELFMADAVNRREAGMLGAFDALVWVVDPVVAPRAADWIPAGSGVGEQALLDGSLRPGTTGSDVARINREQIQETIGRRITVLDGPFARDEGRPLQMLVAISKCDLIHAALSGSGLRLPDLGAPGQVLRGVVSYLSSVLKRWVDGSAGADGESDRLLTYLRGSAQASPALRAQRVEQVARALLDHYSQAAPFWALLHQGAGSSVAIRAQGIAEHPYNLQVTTLDEHLGAARQAGSAREILIRDLVMSAIGCGIAYALDQETALQRMLREPWIELRFFLCSPLTTVPVAVDDLRVRPLDPSARFPAVDERSAGLTHLLLALLERARR
jgi:hypothetical protein